MVPNLLEYRLYSVASSRGCSIPDTLLMFFQLKRYFKAACFAGAPVKILNLARSLFMYVNVRIEPDAIPINTIVLTLIQDDPRPPEQHLAIEVMI
jgi:hypothetical protein